MIGHVAGFTERLAQIRRGFFIVFDQENAHRASSAISTAA